MSDLIDRMEAINAIKALEEYAPTAQHLSAIFDCEDMIKNLPSAEQKEHMAKVDELEKRSETNIGWEGICTNCGAYTLREMNFCFLCGAKLEWK